MDAPLLDPGLGLIFWTIVIVVIWLIVLVLIFRSVLRLWRSRGTENDE